MPLFEGLIFRRIQITLAGKTDDPQGFGNRSGQCRWRLRAKQLCLAKLSKSRQPLHQNRATRPALFTLDQNEQPFERNHGLGAFAQLHIEPRAIDHFGLAATEKRRSEQEACALEFNLSPTELKHQKRGTYEGIRAQRHAQRRIER